MKKQYKSEAFASAHDAAMGLAEADVLSKRVMREFDELCLTSVRETTPADIREPRLREHAGDGGAAARGAFTERPAD